jgi:nitrogenase molybdenum-cofactor synthesis protein NifE
MKAILDERKGSIGRGGDGTGLGCGKRSVSGSVSQRACVYCGARVVLNPITDAFHIVHGPIGCASYTWDIRGSLSSGSERYRNSFSTDLREHDVIFGGAKKLEDAIDELAAEHDAKLVFVYATCIAGVIGDDVDGVCRRAERRHGIRAIPVKAPGFSGTKSQGYRMACDALMTLFAPHKDAPKNGGVNILGDFNLAGEMWIIKNYLAELGIPAVSTITGDASHETLIKAPSARLNLVQCAGSMNYLAKRMEDEWGVPSVKVSFFGTGDTRASLIRVAEALGDARARSEAAAFCERKSRELDPLSARYRPGLRARKRRSTSAGASRPSR